MRARAIEIEELKRQLKTYEAQHLPMFQDGVDHRRNYGSVQPENEETVQSTTPRKERCAMPLESICGLHQEQNLARKGPDRRQAMSSPKPVEQQQMSWTTSGVNFGDSALPALGSSLDGTGRPDGTSAPDSNDFMTTLYDDCPFDVPPMNEGSRTPTSLLHLAVAGNHVETLQVLLQDRRVVIDEKDNEGFTALQRAVMHGRSEAVKLLLERSAKNTVGGCSCELGTKYWEARSG